jgi:hypothetical protein
MIAMTSCVKWLALPGTPPGPCDANAEGAERKAAVVAHATAKGELQCRFRGEAMMISRNEKL